jgi:hypothetical protein
VDHVYNTNVIMSGLIQFRLSSNHPDVALDVATMAQKLGQDFTMPKDRLWSLSPDAGPPHAKATGQDLLDL